MLSVLVRRAALTHPQLAATLHLAAAEQVDERADGALARRVGDAARRCSAAPSSPASQTADLLAGLRVHADRMAATLSDRGHGLFFYVYFVSVLLYPLVNSFGDAIPALAAGNTVILKPSEVTPLTSMLLAEGFRESGMPEHVLQILVGGADTGVALIDEANFVMFTGSTATGKKVMARAAETLTPGRWSSAARTR